MSSPSFLVSHQYQSANTGAELLRAVNQAASIGLLCGHGQLIKPDHLMQEANPAVALK